MENIHISTDGTPAAKPARPPKRQGRIDQTKDVARKVLAMITGRAKS